MRPKPSFQEATPHGDLGAELVVERVVEGQQVAQLRRQGLLHLVLLILAIGAVFGAMNTMYAAVAYRTREIGTLRALGFPGARIVAAFLAESIALALVGGVLGCLLALPVHGMSTGTTNFTSFSEVAFKFRITPGLLAGGLVFSVVMGAVGGVLPAIRAARIPVARALREI